MTGSSAVRNGPVLRVVDGGGGAGWPEGDNPYPGLEAFTAALARMFCGKR
jgi:hypothetical protein